MYNAVNTKILETSNLHLHSTAYQSFKIIIGRHVRDTC